MSDHRIEVDEMNDGGNDFGYGAFCDCGWNSGWSHSDAMRSFRHGDPSSIEDARNEAFDEAESLGEAHIEDSECQGHESLDGAHMGEAVYCDGSCTRTGGALADQIPRPWVQAGRSLPLRIAA